MIKFTIIGNVPSKSNCYEVGQIPKKGSVKCRVCGNRGTRASMYKAAGLRKYEKNFQRQLTGKHRLGIECRLTARLHVYYDSERPDLDNCFKVIFDCLQPPKVKDGMPPIKGVIKNDRQIRKIVAERFKDTKNPRVEIQLTEYFPPEEQLLFPPGNAEVAAWVDAEAPDHIRRALLALLP